MKWSIQVDAVDPVLLTEALEAERDKFRDENLRRFQAGEEAEVMAQINGGIRSAIALLAPTVGRGRVDVTMMGHSNPDHRLPAGPPRRDTSADTVLVSVTNTYEEV